MRAPHRIRIAQAVLAVAACGALAACDAASPNASASAAPSIQSDAQILATARQYAQCMREHGLPSFGDPVVRDGRLRGFAVPPEGPPDEQQERTADEACQHILADLPASATNREISEADLAKLVQLAKCMRDNGITEWPDPKSDGSFPEASASLADKSDERVNAAMRQCRQYAPADGLSFS